MDSITSTANGKPFHGSMWVCPAIDSLLLCLRRCAVLSINAKQQQQQRQQPVRQSVSELVGEGRELMACLGFWKLHSASWRVGGHVENMYTMHINNIWRYVWLI